MCMKDEGQARAVVDIDRNLTLSKSCFEPLERKSVIGDTKRLERVAGVSCAIPATSTGEARAMNNEEFRSRSKSLDGDHIHKVLRRPLLEDCGATYEIFEAILREGMNT
ncbi:unnamed protein product [Arctia plantaginis]|uniref:Uncharacterized protein n=1 Tax=Arctia plantaginis TaxID=874455 RepID=A0A8S1BKZ7_ARCPL|nr:unnamed protein product [Arctia plantaginis]